MEGFKCLLLRERRKSQKGYKEMTVTLSHSGKDFFFLRGVVCGVWNSMCSVHTCYYRCVHVDEEATGQPWVSFLLWALPLCSEAGFLAEPKSNRFC